uniref:Uncharacterized protein n=1 Tax=Medicago truncatula TaxID=3880 RepID=I3S3X6_MEDTR|nr:unknown [Medicago truncatula]
MQQLGLYDYNNNTTTTFDGTIHLPQLFSPESAIAAPPTSFHNSSMDILECSQNLLRLTTTNTSSGLNFIQQQQQGERLISGSDWSFLDKLLASHNGMDFNLRNKLCNTPNNHQAAPFAVGTFFAQKFPFHYLGCESHDIMKFSK